MSLERPSGDRVRLQVLKHSLYVSCWGWHSDDVWIFSPLFLPPSFNTLQTTLCVSCVTCARMNNLLWSSAQTWPPRRKRRSGGRRPKRSWRTGMCTRVSRWRRTRPTTGLQRRANTCYWLSCPTDAECSVQLIGSALDRQILIGLSRNHSTCVPETFGSCLLRTDTAAQQSCLCVDTVTPQRVITSPRGVGSDSHPPLGLSLRWHLLPFYVCHRQRWTMWMLTPVSCFQYTACRSYYVKRHSVIPWPRFPFQTLDLILEQRDKEVFVWKGLRVVCWVMMVSFMTAACPPDPANLFFSHTSQQTLSKSGTVSLLLCGSSLGLVASSVSVGALRQCSDETVSASGCFKSGSLRRFGL